MNRKKNEDSPMPIFNVSFTMKTVNYSNIPY